MSASSGDQAALLDALLARVGAMAEEIVEQSRAELPSFAGVPRDEHLADTRQALELVVRGTLGSGGAGLESAELEELAARRARQGVRVEELLRAWRMSIRLGTERAREVADELGVSPELVIQTFQGALGTADQAMTVLAAGHRAASDVVTSGEDDFVARALAGALPIETLRTEASTRGLDLTRQYHAVRARVRDQEAAAELARALAGAAGDAPTGGFFRGDDEIAGFTHLEPDRTHATRAAIAVGPALPLEHLAASDRVAARVLTAVRRFGLNGVHDISSAGAYVAVIEAGDVGEGLVERYLAPVRDKANSEDLIQSLRVWLDSGRRIEPAAERLHVHPNTLRHRLSRYEEAVDADLSVTEEIVGLWWALQRERAED